MLFVFNIKKVYILPTRWIYGYCLDLKIDNDYFPICINRLVFITERKSVCAAR